MRFLRTFLALFLLLFTSEFCDGQSWDWVAGTSNSNTPTLNCVTPNGDIYILRNNESVLTSSSDSQLSSGETLTKLDKTGKRVAGRKIDIKDYRKYTQFTSLYVRDNIVYALLFANAEITINGKTFPDAGNSMMAHNVILIKFDADCNVLESIPLGFKMGYPSAKLIVDKSLNLYLTFAIEKNSNDYYERSDKTRYSSSTQSSERLLFKFDKSGNHIWSKTYDVSSNNNNYGLDPILFDTKENILLCTSFYPFNLDLVDAQSNTLKRLTIGKKSPFHLAFSDNIWVDKNDNLFIGGYFGEELTLPNDEVLTSKNYTRGILIKFDKNLNMAWYKTTSQIDAHCFINTVITDKDENIYIAGNISQPERNTKPLMLGNLEIETKKNQNQFFMKMDRDGNGKWVSYLKNSLVPSSHSYSINKDDCDNIYFLGISDNEIGPGIGDMSYNKSTIGQHSIYNRNDLGGYFLAKLNADSLEIEVKRTCKSILLTNKSDKIIYKSFEWTLPDKSKKTGDNITINNNDNLDTILITLIGIKKDGCENITTQKIGIPSLPKPTAYFTTDSFTGCQWVGIKFYDSSFTLTDNEVEGSWKWDFGDGEFSSEQNPTHIFTKTGNYIISLTYCNGSKQDTFILPKKIEIIEAPKPDISTIDTFGCIPFLVKINYSPTSPVTQYFYTSTDGQSSNQASPTFIYTKPGKYFITQMLKGPTGCITKDSALITIRPSFNAASAPEILTATVTDSNFVKVSWKKNPVAAKYQLTRQSGNFSKPFILNSSDTFYLDKDVDVAKAFYSYTLYGLDSCGNTKAATNIARSILLQKQDQTKEYNLLRWSAYEKWQNGVQEYKLLYKLDSDFVQLTALNNTVNIFKDANQYTTEKSEICYKIIASEKDGNKQISQSNMVCMPFLPSLIIPNAFSPNNDLLNDTFSPATIGIESYTLNIYNRWGEKVFTGTNADKSWDGKFKGTAVPEGVYLYKISAKPYSGKIIYQSGNLQLLR